jgi:Sad1 / UNC-like C-terminal
VIVPPPPLPTTKPSPAAIIKPQPVSTPAMKLARDTPHVPLQAPAVVARTEVPPEPDLAPDVAMPPSATFWRTLGLDRTLGWLVLLLLLQLLLFPLWKQTIWSGTMALSHVLVSVVRWTDRTAHHPQEEIQKALQTLDQLQGNLQELQQQEAAHWQQWQAAVEQTEDFDAKEHQARRASLTAQIQQLHEANEEDDVEALVDIVEAQNDDRPGPQLLHLAHLRRLLSKLLPPEHSQVRPEGTCGDDAAPRDVNASDALRSKLSAQIQWLQRNDTTHPLHRRARLWVQRQVQQQVRRFQTALDKLEQRQKDASSGKDPNALLRALQRVIEQRFIMESSGGDHRIDYAAVQHGGRVVASSASLVDDLPLLNRLAAFWKLRFYGHGPAVALTPSGGTLGHCWSLAGTTGHLTVQLGRAMRVQSVVVEHVAAATGVVAPSAPRALRVYGYATADDITASNDDTPGGVSLGSFEYDYSKAKDGRMEFSVKPTGAPLQYVRLHIDSNWGNPDNYTCLYRFRVYGPPVELL